MKRLSFIFIFFLFQISVFGQNINLSGTVKSIDNSALKDVIVTLANANESTTTDNQGKFNIVVTGLDEFHSNLVDQGSYFDGKNLYIFCQDECVFVDLYDITGRKISSVIEGESLHGTFMINPAAYIQSEGISIVIIRVQMGSDLHSFKAIINERAISIKGIQEVSLSKINNYQKELSNSEMALDKLVFVHDDYETKEMGINNYTAGDLGTIVLEEKLTIPNAPSGLTALAVSADQINLSWTDNSDNEDGFKIERSKDNTSNWEQIATVGADVETYDNSGLSSNTKYYYRIRSYNTAGNSDYSNTDSDQTHMALIIPAAPSNLTVEATNPSTCKLRWSDNSSNETGFNIERQHLSISGHWVTVGYAAENATSFTHSGLNETWPAYRVSASGGLGSSPSNEASAPAKLRIINDLNNYDQMSTYNQIVRVRIGPTESSVTNNGNYERLEPSETTYDISSVETIPPGYTSASSSFQYYEDYDVGEDWNYSNYWVYLQCGWWDYIVGFGTPYWQKTMTIAKCADGINECYKNAWINIYNHFSGYFVLNATDMLPHFSWNKKKSIEKYIDVEQVKHLK